MLIFNGKMIESFCFIGRFRLISSLKSAYIPAIKDHIRYYKSTCKTPSTAYIQPISYLYPTYTLHLILIYTIYPTKNPLLPHIYTPFSTSSFLSLYPLCRLTTVSFARNFGSLPPGTRVGPGGRGVQVACGDP